MPSLSPGILVSHYRIDSLIGRGGMGEVYLAMDTYMSRPVALKVLSPQSVRSEEAVQRFMKEARAATALNHPNIVTVYEIGKAIVFEDDNQRLIQFIAMELIEGETLRSLIDRKAGSLRQSVDLLSQVAAGLAKAHAAGIVHRDLKPDNVMITTDGYAKVLDFGLAKLMERDRVPEASTSKQWTQVGAVLGTVGYMSPEQVEQRAVDHRADVFSFGCIAYQALSGRAPFERGSLIDILHAIVHDDPTPLDEIVPDAPAALVEIVDQCLAKKPENRPQSMRELCGQLQEIARATDPHSLVRLPPARRRPARRAAMFAIPIVLAAAALIAFALNRRDRTPAPFDAMKITRVASNGRSTVASISPDGKYLSYSIDEGGKQSLSIKQLASGADIQIVPLADVHFVSSEFSRDGNYLYYVSADNRTDRGALYQVPVLGGRPRQIIDDLHARISIAPDGQRFAYFRTDRAGGRSVLATRRMDGSDERIVAERKLPDTFTAVTWSPESDALAHSFVTYSGGYHAIIGLVTIADGEQRTIDSPPWRIVDSLVWLPEAVELVVNARDTTDTRNQLWLLGRNGKARRVTNDLSDYEATSITADGRKLVTLQKNQFSTISVASGGSAREARELSRAADNLDGMYGLTVVPDGRVVYSSQLNDARDLWIMDRDGGNRRRLTDGGSDILPTASADGRSVAFMSMRNGRSNIWKVDLTTGAITQTTNGDFDSSPSLGPDGTWLAFHSNRSGVRTIWRVASSGGEPKQVTTTASSWPSIAPDGKSIACSWFDPSTGRIGIAVVPAEGGAPTAMFDIPVNAWMGGNNHHVRWRSDGMAYVSNANGVSNIWLQTLPGGAPRQLTHFDDGQIFYFDWSADGGDLIVARGHVTSNVVLIDGFRRE